MDAVIKVGGSVLQKNSVKDLCKSLDKLIKKFSFVILPGGGAFANLVRNYYKIYQNSDDSAHWMAILSENILGFLILEYLELGKPVFSVSEISEILNSSQIPIFMPFQYIFEQDPLPHSWKVTSDSIAAYLAEILQAKKLILLKDVDGIYTRDPKKFPSEEIKLIPLINLKTAELSNFYNCIDSYLPILLKKYQRDCFIVNGFHPERLTQVLHNEKSIYTKIIL
ncbi:MAG: hypothetical protein ACFFD2_00205 [Promethearchaeota archaeon]